MKFFNDELMQQMSAAAENESNFKEKVLESLAEINQNLMILCDLLGDRNESH